MGIGRREFIKLFSGAIASLVTNPQSAVAVVEELYVNRKLGIGFRCPAGWAFADVKEMGEIKAGQILDIDDSELASLILDMSELPIVTITQESLSGDANRFTPGATVFVDVDEEIAGEPILEAATEDIKACHYMLRELVVVHQPTYLSISGCDAAEYTASFLFEHVNMVPTPVRMRTLLIRQPPKLYTFRLYDSPVTNLIVNYDQFVQSVALL